MSFSVDVNDYFGIGVSSNVDYDFISDFNVVRDFNLNVSCKFFAYNKSFLTRYCSIVIIVTIIGSNNRVIASI